MMKHRISVGALVVNQNKILMVNHRRQDRYDFWVAPGGGVKGIETIEHAVIREVMEETGFKVAVGRLLYIEEMYEPSLRMIKFWYQCEILSGELDSNSPEAKAEFIVDAKFMSKQELSKNIIFPSVLVDDFWEKSAQKVITPEHLPLREMTFY